MRDFKIRFDSSDQAKEAQEKLFLKDVQWATMHQRAYPDARFIYVSTWASGTYLTFSDQAAFEKSKAREVKLKDLDKELAKGQTN